MKAAMKAVLAAVGLAPASQVERLNGDVRRAEAKLEQAERDLELVRADVQAWKRRHQDAGDTVAGWKQAAQRAQAETEQLMAQVDRLTADLERAKVELEREQPRTESWRQRAETLKTELLDVRARADNAQRLADLASEQLMAMEVKLDLIEAAILVLDVRSREQAVSSA
jgi:chromosome segregation ATPase